MLGLGTSESQQAQAPVANIEGLMESLKSLGVTESQIQGGLAAIMNSLPIIFQVNNLASLLKLYLQQRAIRGGTRYQPARIRHGSFWVARQS